MGEVVKNWNNGGSLSVVYTGIGDGNAVISSSKNVGDEREMEVTCVDASRSVIVMRKVVQAAMAEVVETYTRLRAAGASYLCQDTAELAHMLDALIGEINGH